MNKEWPDLKKELDKIPVPMDALDSVINDTIKGGRKKRSKTKAILYTFGATAAGLALFIGSANFSPAMAKIASGIPIVGTFFNDSADEGLRIAGEKGLTQVIDQSSKDSGITLTMNEIFYDGTRLTFGYTQESIFAIGDLERPTIEVNGKEINFSSGSSGDFVTPQKYKGTMDITPTEELPEEFELSMRIDAVGLIPGRWEFKFPVKQSNKVTVIRPEQTNVVEGAEITVDSLKLGPAGTDLNVTVTKDEKNEAFDPYSLYFYVLDDKGNVLNTVTGSGMGETKDGQELSKLNYLYSPLKENSKKIRVIPYTVPVEETGWKEVSVPLEEQNFPLSLNQGEFGDVLVTKAVYKKDKIVLYYTLQTDEIVDDRMSRNMIWLEDGKGKNLMLEKTPLAERIEGNHFKQEFAVGSGKGLTIKTQKYPKTNVYEGFEIDLP